MSTSSASSSQADDRRVSLSGWDIAGYLLFSVLTLCLLWVALVVFVVGWPYYVMPVIDRPNSDLHEWYGPGGFIGLLLGLLGTGLMMVLLLYSVRKWLPFLTFMGRHKWWMRVHMLCGIVGPLFIVLHGAFKLPEGIVGIGFWCMMLVAVSGVFGRYLFGLFPKTAAGRRMDLSEIESQMVELRARLVRETRESSSAEVDRAVRLAREFDYEPRTIGELFILDAEIRRRVDLVRALLYRARLPKRARRRAMRTLEDQLWLKRSMAGWDVARRLTRYWSLFHQPLALAMYLIAALHIFNAVTFGGALVTLFGG